MIYTCWSEYVHSVNKCWCFELSGTITRKQVYKGSLVLLCWPCVDQCLPEVILLKWWDMVLQSMRLHRLLFDQKYKFNLHSCDQRCELEMFTNSARLWRLKATKGQTESESTDHARPKCRSFGHFKFTISTKIQGKTLPSFDTKSHIKCWLYKCTVNV